METTALFSLLLLGTFTMGSAWFVFQSSRRQVTDVLADLADGSGHTLEEETGAASGGVRARFTDELGKLGLVDKEARRLFRLQQRLIPPAFGFAAGLSALLLGVHDPASIVPLLIGGTAFGVLFASHRTKAFRRNYLRSIEHSLPLVMERIVMAAQSGLDVIPAIERISESEGADGPSAADPVIRLLRLVSRISNNGLPLPQALREVSEFVDSPALRHAFIHLAVAYQEGGELVVPLRELSDASQLQYQESVEEEIAALPIKATMPLLCTFAGLILIFITAPLIQILTLTAEAIPK